MAHGNDDSHQRFATTHWSVVLAAGQDSSPASNAALSELCQNYWYPLYAYVRRQGHDAAEAADLTQGFFTSLLERNDLRNVQRDRGKFRSFLLASLRHFMFNEWDRAAAIKRGGDVTLLSIDFHAADSRYRLEPSHQQTPDAIFERQWALTLLDRVRKSLRDEFAADGQESRFDSLQVFLTGEKPAVRYRDVAAELNMTEGALKVAVYRLRQRFGQRLREEITQTVSSSNEVDNEIQGLFEALRS